MEARSPLRLVAIPFTLLLALYASLLLLTAVYLTSTRVNSLASGDSLNWAGALPQWQHRRLMQHSVGV
jgi:hypothetical protein